MAGIPLALCPGMARMYFVERIVDEGLSRKFRVWRFVVFADSREEAITLVRAEQDGRRLPEEIDVSYVAVEHGSESDRVVECGLILRDRHEQRY